MSRLPDINTLLTLRLTGTDTLLSSRVEGIEDGKLFIAFPSDGRGTNHELPYATDLDIEWAAGRGLGQLKGVVRGRTDVGIPALVIEVLGDAKIQQRREHARAEMVLEVEVWPTALSGPVSGVTLDVSGGGMRAVIPAPLYEGQLVRFVVDMPDGTSINGLARVIGQRDDDVAAFEFHEIVPGDRERLIKTVFSSYQGA
jgi:c-di-GMP-binding flagellar brake protein YcgR